MRSLSVTDAIRIWEDGQHYHLIDKAMMLVSVAYPEIAQDKLLDLSIGQRDILLLNFYQKTIGDNLNSFAKCPKCMQPLEVPININDIRSKPNQERFASPYVLKIGDIKAQFRLPTSRDLAEIADCNNMENACLLLAERCVIQASIKGKNIPFDKLPASFITKIAERMTEIDPMADIRINLQCPECSHCWSVIFDIVKFFWTKLMAFVKSSLIEIHTLAKNYGWSEESILMMSSQRRQFYLEILGT